MSLAAVALVPTEPCQVFSRPDCERKLFIRDPARDLRNGNGRRINEMGTEGGVTAAAVQLRDCILINRSGSSAERIMLG